ncbi:MAG: translation initiation factor IF-2 [Bacteroidales bacterium]|jgi:translation initiation factor IF-2|nr:translation initiation factor IF-2 [Bacteroidales bacterium]
MSTENKLPRLGKAASEFNVGIHTIVSFLKKKNFDVPDVNPNMKLTPEMYDVLFKEFNGDRLVKEEAKKIEIGSYNKAKHENSDHNTPKAEPEKGVTHTQPSVVEPAKPAPVIPEMIKTEVPKPKVIGKMDLPSQTTKKTTVKEEPKQETPELKTEIEIQDKESSVPVAEIVIEKLEPTVPVVEKDETQTLATDLSQVTSTPSELKQEVPVVVEEVLKTPEPIKPEHFETTVENLSERIKIVDKIDLSKFNKPSKKSVETPIQPKEEDVVVPEEPKVEPKAETVAPETPAAPIRDANFLETKYEKLQAPVIKGKIDLPIARPKDSGKKDHHNQKSNSQSNQQNTQNGQTNQSNAQGNQNNAQGKPNTGGTASDPNKKKRKRTRIKQSANQQNNANNANKTAPVQKVEITDEDIQRQIRETMQRLEPLGKSKTSKRKREKRQHTLSEMKEHELMEQKESKILKITEFLTANELATLMNIQVTQIISTCMAVGLAVSINQRLDAETISLLADEFGYEVEFVRADVEEELSLHDKDKEEDLQSRHPIITVMGHVDHGKTSLLDYIRKTNVIAGEAGGITQHIGAYLVKLPDGRKITFLDTPGHEAFTAMRARGAKVTDLVIIVIAADDSIMPQTVEAINHAQAAGVPMVFAITKIDKANAAPEKIREALANMNILVEEWGGQYQCQEINAKQGTNVDTLLEKVLLEAELLDLKANPDKNGIGTVLESSLDKGKGYVAKVLIQNGSVKVGDPVLAGNFFGKVKALYNERNQPLKNAGPATPVLLLGLNGAPQAGDIIRVCSTEHEARVAATKRSQLAREMGLRTQKHITLDEIGRRIAIGDFKELNIIVKGDVDGSVEALSDSLLKLSTSQVQVNVIHKSVGQVTESDVLLASASNAIIVAFQVRPSHSTRKLAEQEGIDIRIYSIIYTAINEIKDAIAGMHSPEIREKILCNLEVREVFKITKLGNIAGCIVLDGKLQRNTSVRLIRDGIVIYTGKLGSLRRFKDDVKEVVAGQDCGLNIENFNDIKVGDIVEGFEEYEVKVTL